MFVLTGCVKRRRTTTRNSLDRRDRRCTRKEIPMKFCSLGGDECDDDLGDMHFGENPFAGSRVRQSGNMANDLFVKNRWMFGGIFGGAEQTTSSTSISKKRKEKEEDVDEEPPKKKNKKKKKSKKSKGGNTKKWNPALI